MSLCTCSMQRTCGAQAQAHPRPCAHTQAFDWSVLGGHIPTMELLAAHTEVDINALNKFGCAAVQWAAASGNVYAAAGPPALHAPSPARGRSRSYAQCAVRLPLL